MGGCLRCDRYIQFRNSSGGSEDRVMSELKLVLEIEVIILGFNIIFFYTNKLATISFYRLYLTSTL